MGEGKAKRGPGDAVAGGVDLFFAGRAADLGHRAEVAVADVVIKAGPGIAGIGVDPGDDEQGEALVHDPLDQRIRGLQVHDVELVDPGREDDQRGLVDLVGGGGVLDQLHHPVAVDDFTRGGGKVLADVERLAVGEGDGEVAVVRFDVADQVLEALHQAHPVGLYRLFQRIGVGGEEIRRAEHVDDLPGEILHAAAIFGGQRLHVADGGADRLGVHLVLLLEVVEEGMRLPQGVLEAAVLGSGIGRGLELALRKGLLRLDIMLEGLAPVVHLMLYHLCGVLHHLGQVGGGGLHVDVGGRAVQRGVDGAALGHRGGQAL